MMKKYRVIVCGTQYGQVYLSAFLSGNPDFRLAGILANGSQRSKQYAKEFGVNLYTRVSEVPPDIHAACVVVRSTAAGGEGTKLAKEFLKRGIHVIQEHPVHPRDIENCLDLAQENNVYYHVNSHYIHVEPITTFIDYLEKAREKQKPLFIEATCSLQTTYSLLDIIGRALGGIQPYGFTRAIQWEPLLGQELKKHSPLGIIPFKCLQGIIKGVPVTLKIQHYYDPEDFDNHLLIMHRVCIGMNNGNLSLVNTHGPVVWSESFSINNNHKEENSFGKRKTAFIGCKTPTAELCSEHTAPSLADVAMKQWPDAVRRALNHLKENILTGLPPLEQSRQYLVDLGNIWINLMKQLGEAEKIAINKNKIFQPKDQPGDLKTREKSKPRSGTAKCLYRNNSWIVTTQNNSDPCFRLFCFPYAGAGASVFREWQGLLPAGVEVCAIQYPGRENRINESPFTDIFEMIDTLTEILEKEFDVPFAFFGHSMGAKVAFEISRKITGKTEKSPGYLFVSGCRAPHLPIKRPIHQLNEKDFLLALKRYAGTPDEVLNDSELMEIYLPILRSDFIADENYIYHKGAALECPIYALGGLNDEDALYDELNAWKPYTTSNFQLKMFPGDHFFIKSKQISILRMISEIIAAQV
jgi:thiazolinyl imide reductase